MKKHRIQIRLSDEDVAYLYHLNQSCGLSRSEIIRQSFHRVRTWTITDRAALAHLNRELARVGNNLNQIARHLNQGHDLDTLAALALIEEDLREIKQNAY
ncbi:MAG: plasmid mobilization relaxosome protein MobC [Ghiorsea sp.]|nr:plasmid mobilization relaxosome protein MobC [Ghiorsea sp.]